MMQAMVPNQQPGRPAQQGVPSRTKQHPAGAMMCSIHQKTRGPNNVEQTFPGSNQWKCKPGSECKLPESQVNHMKDGTVPPGNVTCSIHGKQRGPNNVEPTYPGSNQWRCKSGSECKIPANVQPKDGTVPPGAVICSIHQKTRGPNNVEQTFPGSNQWRCRPGSECKLPANQVDVNKDQVPGTPAPIHPHEPATCWAHGKKRSPNQLHQVNTPFGAQWECLPQFKCKGAAGAPAPATAMPTAAAAAAAASGTPYPVPITGAPGLDSVTNAYLQHTMLMQHGMGINSMQLGIDQGMHERNPRHHRLQGV